DLTRKVLVIEVLLLDWPERFGDVFRQSSCRRLVPGEQPKRLDVEGEGRWRAFRPKLGNLGLRHRVVAAVHFDQRKLRRVVAKPFFRAIALRWVEAPGGDQ